MRTPESDRIGVVRESENRDLGPRLGDVFGFDPREVANDQIRWVDAVPSHQPMVGEKPVELRPEEQVDPHEQDRRHATGSTTGRPPVTLAQGLELMRAERWFDAHEAFEAEWREAEGDERDFLQGLVHVTVAWHHAAEGNRRGAGGQLEKARTRLSTYAPEHRGVDVARVLGQVEAAEARVAEGLLDLIPVRI
jgi:hypothetical protein